MTGRGQVAQLAFEDGWDITLIDKDIHLVNRLRHAGEYTVRLLSNQPRDVTIRGFQVFHIDETNAIDQAVSQADLIITSVLEPNLEPVARILAPALTTRIQANNPKAVNVIAAENMGDSTTRLREYIWQYIPNNLKDTVANTIGFPNSMISRVVPISNDPLHILTEEYSEWTADQYARVGNPPPLAGLEWVVNRQPTHSWQRLLLTNRPLRNGRIAEVI